MDALTRWLSSLPLFLPQQLQSVEHLLSGGLRLSLESFQKRCVRGWTLQNKKSVFLGELRVSSFPRSGGLPLGERTADRDVRAGFLRVVSPGLFSECGAANARHVAAARGQQIAKFPRQKPGDANRRV